ncbi:MAG: hypothetical protein QXN23_05870 [Candidatus Caldarchaeum sp.]
MSVFGRFGRLLVDVIKGGRALGRRIPYSMSRPAVLDPWTRGISDVTKLPTLPYFGYKFIYELYLYSDVLRLTIRSLVQETIRKGLAIRARFAVKCLTCGAEFDVKVSRCDYCKSTNLREPSLVEYRFLESFLNDVNYNDQTLIEVIAEVLTDINLYDNAFLAVVKEYSFNESGEVVGAKVKEVLRVSPELVGLIMDSNGMFGRSDDGNVVMICLQHREKYHLVKDEEVETARCPTCGLRMYPAYFSLRKGTYASQHAYVYYTNGEILHIKKFTHGIGYGMSPVYSLWMKLITLMKQDYFILTAYSLERPPKALLVLKGNIESLEKSFQRLMEEARNNPHMIYPLIVEPTPGEANSRVVEYVDLTYSPKDIDFIAYREEVRRTIGAVWGVMPIFSGDVGGGAGLANEGLQIVVTNRAVEREQHLVNTKVLDWLRRQLGVSDWDIFLVPNEGRDVVARIQRERMRIDNALSMMQMGYRPIAFKTEDGIDFDYVRMDTEEPISSLGAGGAVIKPPISGKKIPRYEGEPEHGRPRTEEQRFEGEELERRHKTPSTFVVGEGGELIPEDYTSKDVAKDRLRADVPEEYRHYLRPEDLGKLPPGTRVHRGPLGGLFIDVREVSGRALERLQEREETDVSEPRRRSGETREPDVLRLETSEFSIEAKPDLSIRNMKFGDKFEERLVLDAYDRFNERMRQVVSDVFEGEVVISNVWDEINKLSRWLQDFLDNPEKVLPEIHYVSSLPRELSTNVPEYALVSRIGRAVNLFMHDNFIRLNPRYTLDEELSGKLGLPVYVSEKAVDAASAAEQVFTTLTKVLNPRIPIVLTLSAHPVEDFGPLALYSSNTCIEVGRHVFQDPHLRPIRLRVGSGDDAQLLDTGVTGADLVLSHEYSHYVFQTLWRFASISELLAEPDLLPHLYETFDQHFAQVLEQQLSQDRDFVAVVEERLREAGFASELEDAKKRLIRSMARWLLDNPGQFSTEDMKVFMKVVTTMYGRLRDLVGSGLFKAVRSFARFLVAVDRSDGLTDYSFSYHEKFHVLRYTEAFASFAQFFVAVASYLKSRGRLRRDEVIKFGREVLSSGDMVAEEPFLYAFRSNLGEYLNGVLEAFEHFVDVYDSLGLVKWDE